MAVFRDAGDDESFVRTDKRGGNKKACTERGGRMGSTNKESKNKQQVLLPTGAFICVRVYGALLLVPSCGVVSFGGNTVKRRKRKREKR